MISELQYTRHLPQNQPDIKDHIKHKMEPSLWRIVLKILALANTMIVLCDQIPFELISIVPLTIQV